MNLPSSTLLAQTISHTASRSANSDIIGETGVSLAHTMNETIKIAVVGSGYVGLVAAVCFAEMGHDVICVDNDERKVAALQGGDTLIHENHLPKLLERYRNTKVRFMTDLGEATRESEAIFIAVGTPQSEAGDADLSYVEAVACEIARELTSYKVIVEKSTVPVYTNEWVRRCMERNGVARHLFDVVSNPEFLREGTAVSDFLHPDRIVVGADSERAAAVLNRIYAPLTSGEYYERTDAIPGTCCVAEPPPLLLTSAKSAEIIKHASNAFLALKISYINAVSNLCEATDANVEQVARGMGLDSRIGPRFLRPGIGYGGSCFPKDVKALRHSAVEVGYEESILAAVESVNDRQKTVLFQKIKRHFGSLQGKTIALWGLAFKPNTDDMREAPSRVLMEALWKEGASVRAYDPVAMPECARIYAGRPGLTLCKSSVETLSGADALAIVTEWREFRSPDFGYIKSALRTPVIFDGRNLYDPSILERFGFTYYAIGRGQASGA